MSVGSYWKKLPHYFYNASIKPRTRKRRAAESSAPKNAAPEIELSAASGLTSGPAAGDTSSSEEVFFEASLDDFEDIDAVLQRHISGTISDKIRGGGFPHPDHVVSHIRITWFSISGSRGFSFRITWFSISGSCGFHIRIKWFPYPDHVGFPYPVHVVSISGSRGFHVRITWFPYPDHVVSISGSRGLHIRITLFPCPDLVSFDFRFGSGLPIWN